MTYDIVVGSVVSQIGRALSVEQFCLPTVGLLNCNMPHILSSPNLNLGSAGLSTNALHQHVNGGGQHTLPKVSKTIISASIESNFNCHLPPAACIQL